MTTGLFDGPIAPGAAVLALAITILVAWLASRLARRILLFPAFELAGLRSSSRCAPRERSSPETIRAYGYEPPGHLLDEPRMFLRKPQDDDRDMLGDTSPGAQEKLGLNEDTTWHRQKSEGERLRE